MARPGFSLALLCAACATLVARGEQLENTVPAKFPWIPSGFPWTPRDFSKFYQIVEHFSHIVSSFFKNFRFPGRNLTEMSSESVGFPGIPSESVGSPEIPSASVESYGIPSAVSSVSRALSLPCPVDSDCDYGDLARIVGGDTADIASYPWQVSFQHHGTHVCGGSIINEHWILTAGHCFKGVDSAKDVSFRVGTSDRRGREYQAESYTTHPMKDVSNIHYDVGLVRLAEAIAFSDNVRAVTLVSEGNEPKVGEMVTVTGWGVRNERDKQAVRTLQSVNVPVVDRASCTASYAKLLPVTIDSTVICAGYPEGGKDACKGDSGGPVTNSEGVQVGVVSWGVGCARPGVPGVYANLANQAIRAWILGVAYAA